MSKSAIEGETRKIWRRRGNFPYKLSGKRTLIDWSSGEAFLNVIKERTEGALAVRGKVNLSGKRTEGMTFRELSCPLFC